MKLPQNLLNELLLEVGGKDSLSVFNLLKEKQNVSEFKIAEKLNWTVNEVRNILYKLNYRSLIISTRKKDKQKGWYVYFWTFDSLKAKHLIVDLKEKRIKLLQQQLVQEHSGQFYKCPKGCTRVNTTIALEMDYKCNECGSVLQQDTSSLNIEKMKNAIAQHQRDIQMVEAIDIPMLKIQTIGKEEEAQERTYKPFVKRPHPAQSHPSRFQQKRPFHHQQSPRPKPPLSPQQQKKRLLERLRDKLRRRK